MGARCACGLEAVIMTSWTNRNPGRRFYGFSTLSLTCVNFLRWYDPPMCQRSVQIIPGLLRSRTELEEIVAMAKEKRRKLLKFLIIGWLFVGFYVYCSNVMIREFVFFFARYTSSLRDDLVKVNWVTVSVGNLDDDLSISSSLHNLTEDD
ncbi:hypothetical protein Tco_0183930 [Tanacetum coccineum]